MAVRNDFAPGEVLAAGDLNDTFSSKLDVSTAASTYLTTATAASTYLEIPGNWLSWSPTLAGPGWTFKDYSALGRYRQLGKVVHAVGVIIWDSTGSEVIGSGSVNVNLPVAQFNFGPQMGLFRMEDSSLNKDYAGLCRVTSATALMFAAYKHNADSQNVTADSIRSASLSGGMKAPRDDGDTWHFSITYQAAE